MQKADLVIKFFAFLVSLLKLVYDIHKDKKSAATDGSDGGDAVKR